MSEIQKIEKELIRSYIPGHEWVYFKIYCGPKTGDKILNQVVLPLVEELLPKGKIDRWFFIRYGDPDFHIRVRFHIPKPENVADVIVNLNQAIEPFVKEDLIWKLMIDTYQREIERYGMNSMDYAEDIFYADSQMIAELVGLIDGDEGEKVRWLFSLRAMDAFLNDFHCTVDSKVKLLHGLSTSFGQEHNKDERLAKQLSKKFRESKKDLHDVLNYEKDADSDIKPALDLIQQKSELIKIPVQKIMDLYQEDKMELPLLDLLSSYLHMLNNRLFRSKNRLHELVVYDFLFRYYKSKAAREKYEAQAK